MHRFKKFILLIVVFFIVQFFFTTVNAENNVVSGEATYTQKIVSILYDNSGSMDIGDKTKYALYSLQTLIGLMDEKDELIVCPMNISGTANTNTDKCLHVDLTNPNREQEIKKVIENKNLTNPYGSTPISSIDTAISTLVEKGLTKISDGITATNKEYWLIILTDGRFWGTKQLTDDEIPVQLETKIKDYANLKTVYFGFSSEALNLSNSYLTTKYPFIAYYTENGNDISKNINNIANRISGRFSVKEDIITTNNKSVFVDLKDYEVTLKTISVILQNSGAKLVSAKYKGNEIDIVRPCLLQTQGIPGIEEGYLGTVKMDSAFSSGEIEFVFDKAVSKENIIILVEPLLFIDLFIEYKDGNNFVKTDLQYLNSHLTEHDVIKVGYSVIEGTSYQEVELEKIFGNATETIIYGGKKYDVGEEIPLKVGKNELSISVSVQNGAYSMQTSKMIIIDKNPLDFRIDALKQTNVDGDASKNKLIYSIIYEGKEIITKEGINNFRLSIEVFNPKGVKQDASLEIKDDGKIEATVQTDIMNPGDYIVRFVVLSPENTSRISTETVSITMADIKIDFDSSTTFALSEYGLKYNVKALEFNVTNLGIDYAIDPNIFVLKVTIDGVDVSNDQSISIVGSKIVVIPTLENTKNTQIGKHNVNVEISNKAYGKFACDGNFEITEIVYQVINVGTTDKEIDIYDLKNEKAYAAFKITADGCTLTEEELNGLLENGSIKIKKNSAGWLTLLPCKLTTKVENINGENVIKLEVGDDFIKPFDNLFASFIFAKEKEVKLSLFGSEEAETFIFNEVSFSSRIIKWVILLIILLFIIHVILYIIGFFVLTPNPKCKVTVFKLSQTRLFAYHQDINIGRNKNAIILWHLFRFIPFMELKPQGFVEIDDFKVGRNKDGKFVVQSSNMLVTCQFIDTNDALSKEYKKLVDKWIHGENANFNNPSDAVDRFANHLRSDVKQTNKTKQDEFQYELTCNKTCMFGKALIKHDFNLGRDTIKKFIVCAKYENKRK